MPTVEISSVWAERARYRMLMISGSGNSPQLASLYGGAIVSATYSAGEIRIYKGSSPGIVNMWSSATQYDADLLLKWTRKTPEEFQYTPIDSDKYAMSSTVAAAASQSGVATWFAWLSRNCGNDTVYHLGIGTVGTAGSGADLQLASTTITSGELYMFSGLVVVVPTIWTYT